jgi:hypothetical protein
MIIYKITNNLNNKIYIGQTIRKLDIRWNSHCCKSSTTTHIGRAIQKYGKENFSVEEIDRAETYEELNEKEIYWISFYNTLDQDIGYNLRTGGDKFKMLQITKDRISKANKGRKGRPRTDEEKAKVSVFFKGKKNPTYKRKSGYKRGKMSPEIVEKMRERTTGRKHSEETKKKMSEVKKGKIRTDEHRKNLSISNTGKKASEEAKSNMRKARFAYLEKQKWEEENINLTQQITEINSLNSEEE